MGEAAVVKKTLPIAVVASRASLVSVVGGSIPDEGVFFCFLSEKCTFRQKRIYGGILYNGGNTAQQSLLGFGEGAWGIWITSVFFRVCVIGC